MKMNLVVRKYISKIKFIFKQRRYAVILTILLIIFSLICYLFVSNNEDYYHKTIAKITSVNEKEDKNLENENKNTETILLQEIQAVIMNGPHKGEKIKLQNTASYSQVNDLSYKVNDEVFIKMTEDTDKRILSSAIVNYKRDKYIAYIIIIFVLVILLIGGYKGLRSLASVIVNISILAIVVSLYLLKNLNLIMVSSIASLIFIAASIMIVSGVNKKTLAAIIGTIAGTFVSMLIAVLVILMTHSKGIHYEEMEFLTHPPEQIFLSEILIGTLGAIMDIAISISSAIKEIYDRNPGIEIKTLINSGLEIGKDIMGTMSNTLVFAYISGSIPIIILWLKNGISTFYIINYNISLEIIRALTGSIGIVLSIPVTIFVSVVLFKKHWNGVVIKK